MGISGGLSSGIQIVDRTVNTANTSEDMNGTFSVYYERNDGTRQPVPGGSASLLIPQGQTGAMPPFSIPADAAQPATFTLVFHGALGMEDNGVAGTQFQVADLTVSESGNGTGTVTSSPKGINCDSSCRTQTVSFVLGSVTLTAVPSANSTFVGWSGGCTGLEPSVTISFTGSETCVANFQTSFSSTNPFVLVTGYQCVADIQTNTMTGTISGIVEGPAGATFTEDVGVTPVLNVGEQLIGKGQNGGFSCSWPNVVQPNNPDPFQFQDGTPGSCGGSSTQENQANWSQSFKLVGSSIPPNIYSLFFRLSGLSPPPFDFYFFPGLPGCPFNKSFQPICEAGMCFR